VRPLPLYVHEDLSTKRIGRLYDKFVSVKVQLDTTAKDAGNIKAWYADGHNIAVKYGVHAYPTYLIFAPDGHIIHRMVGSRLDPNSFITDVSATFDSTKQYYTLLDQHKEWPPRYRVPA
jgi:hypothetical protein